MVGLSWDQEEDFPEHRDATPGSLEMAFGNADLYSTSLSLIIICVNYSFIDIKFDLEIYLLL